MSAEQTNLLVNRPTLVTPAPQLRIAGMEETVEAQLEALAARYLELQPLMKEFKQIRKTLMELMAAERLVKVGRFEIHRNTHDVSEKFVNGHSSNRLTIR